MKVDNLKSKTVNALLWNSIDKFAIKGGQFIVGIILARLLTPLDFGLIGMITIFISFFQAFVDGGLDAGLIQKQDSTKIDYSTVFIFNFIISSITYMLLYLFSPFISNFYNYPEIDGITKVVGLVLIINALAIVQRSRLVISLDFKTLTKVNVFAMLISSSISIYLAYEGYGVWALVYRQIAYSITTVLFLWFYSTWYPALNFSFKSFKILFSYGSKLLLSNLYGQIFQNIYNIVIGKYYSAVELGYYSQAKTYADITSGTIAEVLQKVTFPVFASIQKEKERMVLVYRRMLRMTAFLILPTMTFLSILSESFVRAFLGEKWLLTVPLLKLLCFARVLYPLGALNLNILKANGYSGLYLKVDISKAPLIIIALLITIPISVKAMVISQVFVGFFAFIINAYVPGKIYGYGPLAQIKDILPLIGATIISSVVLIMITRIIDDHLIKMLAGLLLAITTYFSVCYLLKIKELKELIMLLKNK